MSLQFPEICDPELKNLVISLIHIPVYLKSDEKQNNLTKFVTEIRQIHPASSLIQSVSVKRYNSLDATKFYNQFNLDQHNVEINNTVDKLQSLDCISTQPGCSFSKFHSQDDTEKHRLIERFINFCNKIFGYANEWVMSRMECYELLNYFVSLFNQYLLKDEKNYQKSYKFSFLTETKNHNVFFLYDFEIFWREDDGVYTNNCFKLNKKNQGNVRETQQSLTEMKLLLNTKMLNNTELMNKIKNFDGVNNAFEIRKMIDNDRDKI